MKSGWHSSQMGSQLRYQRALAFTSQILLCHRTQQQQNEQDSLWVSAGMAGSKWKYILCYRMNFFSYFWGEEPFLIKSKLVKY